MGRQSLCYALPTQLPPWGSTKRGYWSMVRPGDTVNQRPAAAKEPHPVPLRESNTLLH